MSDTVLRDKLVSSARDILLLDGYGAVSSETVSARAGVAPKDFAKVFSGRQEVVLAALDAHWGDLSAFMDGAFAADVPPLDRLRRFTEGAYGFQDHQWNRLGCVVGCMLLRIGSAAPREDVAVRERVAGFLADWQSRLEGVIREAQDDGKVRPGDPGVMAWTLVQFIEGVLGMARIQNDVHTLQGMLERSLEFLGAESPLPRR
jgi:TetR/AcrR family transcriptional repressor of nem operon